jgi:hypothetical protein
MPTITIRPVAGAELYHRYPGQTKPQPCYVELDCARGVLSASYDAEIGGSMPMNVAHGHRRRWAVACLTGAAATRLLRALAPLAQRVCDGYRQRWDGRNTVGELSDDAAAAAEHIAAWCEREDDERVQAWDAPDWLGGMGSRDVQRRELGITPQTTDAELDACAEVLRAAAVTDGVHVLEGVERHLARLRDEAR